MSTSVKMYFVIKCFIVLKLISNNCIDCKHFASAPNKKCMPGFNIEWVQELGTSPFAAAPLIADIEGDGNLEIVTASFSGDVNVVSARDGTLISGTKWPFILTESTIHSSPLHYDFDRDGMLDIVLFSSQGEIYILSWDGKLIGNYKLDGLSVDKYWYEKIITAEEKNIHEFIRDQPVADDANFITVDPHVLATPALVDLNSDGKTEEIVVPMTYYYDLDYYSNPEAFNQLDNGLPYNELDLYLASTLVILNATDMSVISTIHMELTKVDAEYPGYQLFTPTVVDLDGTGGPLVIVTGSSAGHLHVFSADGSDRPGFPVITDSIHGQVTVEDVTQDGSLDLIMADVSGNVACYDIHGKLHWEAETSGTSPSGSRIADLHGDGRLQVILTADDGLVWVLDGKTGDVLENWPFKIRGSLTSPPLISKVQTLDNPVVVVLDSNGYLQILGEGNCRHAVTLRETSLVPVLSHDLIPANQGLEFLVSCKDGAVMCLSQTNKTGLLSDTSHETSDLYAWPGETKSVNSFLFGKYGINVDLTSYQESQIMTPSFSVAITVIDYRKAVKHGYTIHVSVGSVLLTSVHIDEAFQQTVLTVNSPDRPMKGHLIVRCVDRHGLVTENVQPVSFHQTIAQDLQWLLVAPSIFMGLLLLFLYGFPAEDLLPSFHQSKAR